MCGIAGIIRFDGAPVDAAAVERMSQRIAHRGPDGAGIYIGDAVGLAHRRLSILDLTDAASQPMWDRSRTAAISYHGEVYNFRDLRRQLVAEGSAFQSSGDTEVVLQACRSWGVDKAARQINAKFAFAFWNDTAREQ